MDTNSYHRTSVGTWENLRIVQIATIVIVISLFTSSLLLGLYYFFIYLISGGNYIWLSLASLSICLILTTPIFLDTGIDLNLNQRSLFLFFPMLFLSLTQFFKKSLFLEKYRPNANKIFIIGIIFFIFVIALNLILISEFPNENQLNLTKYPPDKMGFGIIKLHHNLIAFGILLSISIIISFKSWQEGSSSSGYLCLSFILLFLILPIGFLSYYILDGFNFYFWSILLPVAGVLTLGMFITFGFSVAQGMNDLKQEFIYKQLALNNELESKVNARTADLTKANLMITDSINSASTIQNAILPEIDANSHGFREFKYVWEPRDIVGGDFYWIGQNEDWISLIVADCTGHGIPGAFMTLISNTLLDRVANLSDSSQPDRILDQLNELLESTLKYREGGNTNFGLDCGIICFSRKHNLLRYAGAKTNLYQKIDQEVIEIKGDKKSLGHERKEHPIKFKVSEFGLDQNSSFFIFSDGVTAQVGGEKKLMYEKKRVIAHIKKAVSFQLAINNIVADINQYQAGHKRRDDLTLFGFAI
jgi:serine phosphatase RsbU (regulator of sigma subunit)